MQQRSGIYFLIVLIFLLPNCGPQQTQFYQSNFRRSQLQTVETIKSVEPTHNPVSIRQKKQSTLATLVHRDPSTIAPSKPIKDMNFIEAFEAKAYHEKLKNSDLAIKCAQRMLAVGGDLEDMRKIRLELAELFLNRQDYKEAERHALDYQKFYPSSFEAKRAGYIAIQSNFLSKLSADRDQSKTQTTLNLAQEFLQKYPQDVEYKQSVEDMIRTCYKDLFESEIHVINAQLGQYKRTKNSVALNGAYKRIDYIKEKLLPHLKSDEYKILELELALAHVGKKQDIAKTKEEELQKRFPERATLLAQASRKWWNLF